MRKSKSWQCDVSGHCKDPSSHLNRFFFYFDLDKGLSIYYVIRDGGAGVFPTDMEFVKNFTHPDFQAKSFTPQKCVVCGIFLANLQRKCIKYQQFGHFLFINGLISSMSTVLEMKSG